MQKFKTKQSRVGSGVQGKSSINQGLKPIKCFNHIPHNKTLFFKKLLQIILQLFMKNGSPGWRAIFNENCFLFRAKSSQDILILSWMFGHVDKQLDYKDRINFKIYDVTTWLINNCNTYWPIFQEVKAIRQ